MFSVGNFLEVDAPKRRSPALNSDKEREYYISVE